MSGPVRCLSNAAPPARSAAAIREAILKALAFGERGPQSSIGKGSSPLHHRLLLLLGCPAAHGEVCARSAENGVSHIPPPARPSEVFPRLLQTPLTHSKDPPPPPLLTKTLSAAALPPKFRDVTHRRSFSSGLRRVLLSASRRTYYCHENVRCARDTSTPPQGRERRKKKKTCPRALLSGFYLNKSVRSFRAGA